MNQFVSGDFVAVQLSEVTHPRIKLHSMYFEMGFSTSNKIYARQAVVDRLFMALEWLPAEYGLLIWDIYRPRAVQTTLFEWMRAEVKKKSPLLTDDENYHEASKYASPPSKVGEVYCPPHHLPKTKPKH